MHNHGIFCAITVTFALVIASSAFAADDGTWSVQKFSGEVWVATSGVQQASVKSDEVLKPGDTIRTGRNGRVLLVRGEESILIAPNSVIAILAEKKEGLATTIKQQAGSILLEVDKKNVKHFEVETPYLAAVVKGTQFRVTVNASGATVDVVRGQVEVADFKTGQIAQVKSGQHATAFSSGNAGLSLGGSGTLQPIQNGQPRASTIERVTVPRNGLTKPGSAAVLQPRHAAAGTKNAVSAPKHGVTRISSALGEVKLNAHRVTHGLVRNAGTVAGTRSAANRDNSASADPGSSSSAGSTSVGNGSGGSAGSNGNGVGGTGGNGGSAGPGSTGGNSGGGVAGVVGGAGGTVGGIVGGVNGTVGGVVGGVGGGNGNGNGHGNGNGNNGNHYGWFKR